MSTSTTTEAALAAAQFILDEADSLGIRVGTDGTELALLIPLKLPRETRASFEAAAEANKAGIIELIAREGHR